MRLPNRHTCPVCGVQFQAEMWVVVNDAFHCSQCGDTLDAMKKDFRRFLFEIGFPLFIDSVLADCDVTLAQEDYEELIARTSLSAHELTEILAQKSHRDTHRVFPESLKHLVYHRFVEDFGRESIDVQNYDYAAHFQVIHTQEIDAKARQAKTHNTHKIAKDKGMQGGEDCPRDGNERT